MQTEIDNGRIKITREGRETRATLDDITVVFTGKPSEEEITRGMYARKVERLEQEAEHMIKEARHKLITAAHLNRHFVGTEGGALRIEAKHLKLYPLTRS